MPPFYEAIDRYEGIREAVFEVVQTALSARLKKDPRLTHLRNMDVRIGPIDRKALMAAWAPATFPWPELHALFRPHVKRFEVAIWVDQSVCALAYGCPSKGNDKVTIHLLERSMDNSNPLKGVAALLVTEVAELYAVRLGKKSVKLKEPQPEVRSLYRRLGFQLAPSIRGIEYMKRRIEQ